MIRPLSFLLVVSTLALAACDKPAPPREAETDPAIAAALDKPLMTDPELAGDRGAALAVDDGRIALPPEDRSPESVASARQAALALAGGALLPLPTPGAGGPPALGPNAITAAEVARASGLASAPCLQSLAYSASWAAELPATVPVYPQAAVQEAAGSDAGGCGLRVVHFVTPVPAADVVAFTLTLARKGGYDARHRTERGDLIVGGRKGSAAYALYARTRDGLTEVDLVTAGR